VGWKDSSRGVSAPPDRERKGRCSILPNQAIARIWRGDAGRNEVSPLQRREVASPTVGEKTWWIDLHFEKIALWTKQEGAGSRTVVKSGGRGIDLQQNGEMYGATP